jgi:hypothetical protein
MPSLAFIEMIARPLRCAVELACRWLTIRQKKLWQEPEANSDVANIESGTIPVKISWEVAMTLAANLERPEIPQNIIANSPSGLTTCGATRKAFVLTKAVFQAE